MSWDSIAMGQKFLKMANNIHPDAAEDNYMAMLALQEVYDQCYMSSYSRESLMKFFETAAAGGIDVPEEITDVETFRKHFTAQAGRVKTQLIKEGVL
jgi:hypothetical protein